MLKLIGWVALTIPNNVKEHREGTSLFTRTLLKYSSDIPYCPRSTQRSIIVAQLYYLDNLWTFNIGKECTFERYFLKEYVKLNHNYV